MLGPNPSEADKVGEVLSLGKYDGGPLVAIVGSCVKVGAMLIDKASVGLLLFEGPNESLILGGPLGSLLGGPLGCNEGEKVGIYEGDVVGIVLGAKIDGARLGSFDRRDDGMSLGRNDGVLLKLGSMLGSTDGKILVLGRALGTRLGSKLTLKT